jgi:hypothetical protein
VPRIIGRILKVPALVTVVAVLLGGALLGSWACGHPGRRGPAAARPRSALPPPGPHLSTHHLGITDARHHHPVPPAGSG